MSLATMFRWLMTTLGGAVGWWIGSRVSFFTAFMVSIVGTGLGMFAGRRLADRYLP